MVTNFSQLNEPDCIAEAGEHIRCLDWTPSVIGAPSLDARAARSNKSSYLIQRQLAELFPFEIVSHRFIGIESANETERKQIDRNTRKKRAIALRIRPNPWAGGTSRSAALAHTDAHQRQQKVGESFHIGIQFKCKLQCNPFVLAHTPPSPRPSPASIAFAPVWRSSIFIKQLSIELLYFFCFFFHRLRHSFATFIFRFDFNVIITLQFLIEVFRVACARVLTVCPLIIDWPFGWDLRPAAPCRQRENGQTGWRTSNT